ncbi:MAG: inositol monophosphatase family protein [Bacteriovoracaceae bacterium]
MTTKRKISENELEDYLSFATLIALEAGEILLSFEKKIGKLLVHHKKAQGVASTADLKSEAHIIKRIKKVFKGHHILAEEDSYKKGQYSYQTFIEQEFTWVIDPLDGTNNFLNGFNYYGICIALAHYGVPVVGVVFRPSTGELFYTRRGKGAWLLKPELKKPKNLFVEKNAKMLKESIVSTGFATEKGEKISEEFLPFKNILTHSRAVRRMGSAALDMCYVAQGIFDGYWERHLAPWDVAASGIICIEAGVKVSDFNGRNFTPFDRTILVAREPLYHEIKKFIAKA